MPFPSCYLGMISLFSYFIKIMMVDANEGAYVSSEETFDATIMDISYVKS
jgi:hypothetical protein